MRKILLFGAVTMLILAFSGQTFAGTIVGSAHDLQAGSATADVAFATAGNQRICGFCHTPHGATADVIPLWNRTMPTNGGYTSYADPQGTMDATAPGTGWGNADMTLTPVSLACMSCHDGTVALDNLANYPGTSDETTLTAGGTNVNGATEMLNAGTAFIGTDLSNDHPVGFRYTTAETPADPDIRASSAGSPRTVTDGANTVTLYTSGANDDYVECASCHDVHDPGTAAAGTAPFLKVTNTDSALCLVCHTK